MSADFEESLLFYFAGLQDAIDVRDVHDFKFSLAIQEFVQDFGLQKLVIASQEHGDHGLIVEPMNYAAGWFEKTADYLITDQKEIALLVMTADCVPLILFDRQSKVVALIHAGWKGSIAGVVNQAILQLSDKYHVKLENVVALFGPSARWCCYQVQQDFLHFFETKQYHIFGDQAWYSQNKFFAMRNQKLYFDNVFFLQEILKKFGITDQNIYTSNALCTICNLNFCSFRRAETKDLRQLSMVAIR